MLTLLPIRAWHCRAILIGLLSLAGTNALAESRLPQLGDSSSSVLSPHQEEALGKLVLQQIRSVVPLEKDPLIKYFVRRYTYRIAEHSDLSVVKLNPIVIASANFNAFAAPGGIIGINHGVFLVAEDKHEFASVIAHELAHLSQRHYARRLEKQKLATFRNIAGYLTSVAILASGATDQGLAAMYGMSALSEAATLSYSRAQEREADRVGLNTLTRAGFDPFGASRMFERMQQTLRFNREMPEYMSTHPITQSRIADMRSEADKKPRGIFPDAIEYELIRQRVESRFIKNPKEVVVSAKAQNKPYLMAIAASMSGQHDTAIEAIEEIMERIPESTITIGSYAEILTEAGRGDEAIELLEEKLVAYPNSQPLTMFLVKALVQSERFDEAVGHLWDLTRSQPDDQDIWYQLAEIAGLAKNVVDVHRARAEFFVLRGDYKSAITQLRLARERAADSEVLLQSLDQRMQDIRTEAERAEES